MHPHHAWYSHPAYQRFWDHYSSCMGWAQWQRQNAGRGNYPSSPLLTAFPGYHGRLPSGHPQQYSDGSRYGNAARNPPHYDPKRPSASQPSSMTSSGMNRTISHGFKAQPQSRTQNVANIQPRQSRTPRKKMNLKRSRVVTPERDSESGDDMEIEISEDMKQFLLASQQHRDERDARKAAKAEAERTEIRVDATATVTQMKATISEEAPKERPGVRRTFEMKQLYGVDAAKIHGMETAMQLTFDRNCDRFQPKLWPIMPFNIKFA